MDLFKIVGKLAIDGVDEAKKHLKDVSGEGEKTSSKLGKVFSGIGKGAMAIGKWAMVGLGAAATGITALGTAAINSYADYEQLVGGIETLFGTRGAKSVEEYAELVGKSVDEVKGEFDMLQEAQTLAMDNAANAYKTAGLSANEYMETAAGLAAALNQSSGSQLESARLADQAIIDMSDNAAKMGTSMELIQSAYNGFSKQNYTMLDNLKLGYGGTKTEMERLLADAEKISGIKYDISSFADVTEAIHVMQEEMGIAGTTAKEASSTIQGSLGMLKGAWSNLMTGLSDPDADLDTLINNVFESVNTFAGNLVPRISQVLTGIATSFKTLVPLLAAEIPKLLQQVLPPLIEGAVALIDGLVAALPSILSALMSALPMLIEGVVTLVNGIVAALPQIVEMLASALPTLIPQLVSGITSMVTTLCSMLPQIIQPIIDNLPAIIISIVQALVDNLPALIEGIIQLILGIVAALPEIIQALVDATPTVVSLLVTSILENLPLIIMGLVQVVMGIVAALPQIFGALISAIPAAFMQIWDAVKNVFGGIGEWFSNIWASLGKVPGLAQLKTAIETIWGAIKSYITTVIGAVKNVISTAWESIKNVVSTVLESIKNVISTAWNAVKTIISSVMKVISSVLKGDWQGVKDAIKNILDAIKSVIKSVWDGIKNTIKSVLDGIKNTVSSVWNGIKSVITSAVNGIKTVITTVWNGIKNTISTVMNWLKSAIPSAWNSIKSAISNALNGIKTTVKDGFNNVKNSAVTILKSIPGQVASVGMDIVRGIGNGITNGVGWIKGVITSFVGDVKSFIKNLFGIASPSKVMRDEVGRYIAEGVAVGIEANTKSATAAMQTLGDEVVSTAKAKIAASIAEIEKEAADKADKISKKKNADVKKETADLAAETKKKIAAENAKLASEIVKSAKEKLEAHKQYNELTVQAEAEYWDKIRKQFTEGTAERIAVDKEYLKAKDSVDSELLQAAEKQLDRHKTYNEMTLAEEVGFWDVMRKKFAEGTEARLNADKKYLDGKKNLNEQILKAEETLQKELADIQQREADRKNSILGSFKLWGDDDETSDDFYLRMYGQTLALEDYQKEIDKLESRIGGTGLYESIKAEGLDAHEQLIKINSMTDTALMEYVKLFDKRSELAGNLAKDELAEQTMKDTEDAYRKFVKTCSELGAEVAEPVAKMEKGFVTAFDNIANAITKVSEALKSNVVDMFTAKDTSATALTTFAESASMIDASVPQTKTMQSGMMATNVQRLVDLMGTYFPKMLEAFNMEIRLDTNRLVGELAPAMDSELGKLAWRKDRGR